MCVLLINNCTWSKVLLFHSKARSPFKISLGDKYSNHFKDNIYLALMWKGPIDPIVNYSEHNVLLYDHIILWDKVWY